MNWSIQGVFMNMAIPLTKKILAMLIGLLIPAQLGVIVSITHDMLAVSVIIDESVIPPPISGQPYLFL